MNFIAGIILAAIVVDFILHGLADFLNLKMLQDELPEAFHGFYDKDLYRKSQEYLRVNKILGTRKTSGTKRAERGTAGV